MRFAIFLCFLATLLSTSHARIPKDDFNPIRLLRPHSGIGGLREESFDCLSWRMAVETNNTRHWKVIPLECVEYVRYYMLGGQYERDCKAVAKYAYDYAHDHKLKENDTWVFDIDETTLSNLEYYARDDVQFGSKIYNGVNFNKWVLEGKAKAVPGMKDLYKKLLNLGFKILFLTGKRATEGVREAREKNLKDVGYEGWLQVIFKEEADWGLNSFQFKSKKREELVKKGYNIVGNVGDQWTDLSGDPKYTGMRTFKVPNPMYYG